MANHLDVCDILWSSGELRLREIVPVGADVKDGDYTQVLGPHPEHECPFEHTNRVRMGEVTKEGKRV